MHFTTVGKDQEETFEFDIAVEWIFKNSFELSVTLFEPFATHTEKLANFFPVYKMQ